MPSLEDKSSAPAPAPDTMNLPPRMPRVPDAVVERFPEMEQYQSEIDRWYGVLVAAVSETNEESATVINQNNTGLLNLTVTVDGVTASIVELAEIVSDGFGNLSGKYTLTVTAGDVVTGMNITSSTGPGVNISEVTFQADKFQIYSGTTKKVMFVADAIDDVVRLADTLVVDAANGKVYIGDGIYSGATTPFYVDDTGRFSLNDKFVWNGSNLSITGTAQSGNYNPGVDGWLIDEAGNAEFNDVVIRGYLEASFIATDSAFYNPADPAKVMQAVTWQHATDDNGGPGWNNMDITPIEVWMVTFYGWTNASGLADITNRFGQSDAQFTCIENGGCTPVPVGGYIDLAIIYRINGGATVQVTPFDVRVTAASGSGSLNISGGVSPGGLAGGDYIEFGCRLKSALPADMVNVVDLTVSCVNI